VEEVEAPVDGGGWPGLAVDVDGGCFLSTMIVSPFQFCVARLLVPRLRRFRITIGTVSVSFGLFGCLFCGLHASPALRVIRRAMALFLVDDLGLGTDRALRSQPEGSQLLGIESVGAFQRRAAAAGKYQ